MSGFMDEFKKMVWDNIPPGRYPFVSIRRMLSIDPSDRSRVQFLHLALKSFVDDELISKDGRDYVFS